MCINRVPGEILTHSFTYLHWADTSRSARVCKAWQPLAFANPFYWRDIVINAGDVNAEALAFHWTRLRAGGSKPIHFGIQYFSHSRLVEKELIPMLRAAVPRAKEIYVTVHPLYRMDVERALCPAGGAPYLKTFLINYKAEGEPFLDYHGPLAKNLEDKMFRCGPDDDPLISVHPPCPLDCAMIYNVMMPKKSIVSFESVTDLWFINVWRTHMDDFPWFLFDCCPNLRRLRLAGGAIFFSGAPYSEQQLNKIQSLEAFDIRFRSDTMHAMFAHLPLHKVKELHLVGADVDTIYTHALSAMCYPLVIEIMNGEDKVEFNITVRCRQSGLVRHFVEPNSNYFAGSNTASALLLDWFDGGISELRIQTSIWSFVHPWLPRDEDMPESAPCYPTVPRLVLDIDSETPHVVSLPTEPLSLPKLERLVLKGTSEDYGFVRVAAADVVAFADRLTTNPLILELCGAIVVQNSRDVLASRFHGVHTNHP